jgi:hypothetical protein
MAEMLTGSLERVFSTLAGRGNVTVIFHLLGAEVLRFSDYWLRVSGVAGLGELERSGKTWDCRVNGMIS